MDQLSDELIAKYEPLEANKQQTRERNEQMILTNKGFRNMLLSPQFEILHPRVQTVHQDMTKSLVNYYIATSHNTYAI